MKKCFVIMPFSKTAPSRIERYWTDHYNNFLKPKIDSVEGIEAERSKPLRGQILKDIITDLIFADIVVADLTDNNPNVFYELGIRQSFKHGTITIAENGTKVPFDIKGKGVLFYHPKDHIKNAEFEKDFIEALKDCLSNPNKPDSLILETISGRGSFYELIELEEIKRRLTAILSEFNHNQTHFTGLIKRAKERDEGKDTGFTTGLFRAACIELLISNRYLSKVDKFYRICERYYGDLIAFNARIVDWPSREETITKWFIKKEDSMIKLLKEFKVSITDAEKEIMEKK
jgi:hypothetical protein